MLMGYGQTGRHDNFFENPYEEEIGSWRKVDMRARDRFSPYLGPETPSILGTRIDSVPYPPTPRQIVKHYQNCRQSHIGFVVMRACYAV